MIALILMTAAFMPVLETRAQRPPARMEPELLLLDIDGDGVCLTSIERGVDFRFESRAAPERVGWTCPGASDALLVIDSNRDGRISDRSELVGGRSGSLGGFLYLAAHDGRLRQGSALVRGKGDGQIDARDDIYRDLILWIDRNHNGISEEPELESIQYAGVIVIRLAPTPVQDPDRSGNVFTSQTAVTMNLQGRRIERRVIGVRLARRHRLDFSR
jgi:hypothetical protein